MGKIILTYHDDFEILENEVLYPLQTGASLQEINLNMPNENNGINIASKNYKYSEYSAIYYMWKNWDLDFYGLFHYRRVLNLSDDNYIKNNNEYFYLESLKGNYEKFGLTTKNIKTLLDGYDAIIGKPVYFGNKNFYDQYKESEGVYIEHLDKGVEILLNFYPEYQDVVKETLESNFGYFNTLFIMNKKSFNDFCSWIFPLLDELDKHFMFEGDNWYEKRYIGYVAERLFTIYFNYKLKNDLLNVFFAEKVFLTNFKYQLNQLKKKAINRNIYIFGAGNRGKIAYDTISKYLDIKGFIDNDIGKIGHCLNGVNIHNIEEISLEENNFILIASDYFEEIYNQLMKNGFKKNDFIIIDVKLLDGERQLSYFEI